MVRDAEDLARTHPAWFFGGAFILGLAAGRFLKASAQPGMQATSLGPSRRPRPNPGDYGRTTAPGYRPPSTSSSVGVSPTIDVPSTGGMNPSPSNMHSGASSSGSGLSGGYGGSSGSGTYGGATGTPGSTPSSSGRP